MANKPSSHSAKAPKDRNLSPPEPAAFSNREWARTWKAAASELQEVFYVLRKWQEEEKAWRGGRGASKAPLGAASDSLHPNRARGFISRIKIRFSSNLRVLLLETYPSSDRDASLILTELRLIKYIFLYEDHTTPR